jgi:septal ring factor EnvC (AmiA/AmiB activator)
VVSKGELLDLLGVEGDWLKVSINGTSGYVYNAPDYVRLTSGSGASPEAVVEELKKRALELQQELEVRETEAESFSREESETVRKLDAMDRKINARKRQVRKLKRDLSELERSIEERSRDLEDLEKRIEANRKAVSRRLISLYKLNQIGPLNVLASSESLHEMLLRRGALERVLEQDERQRQQLARDLLEAQTISLALDSRRKEKSTMAAALQAEVAELDAERGRRNELLERIRNQKALAIAAISDLKASADDLDRMINSLQKESRSRPGKDAAFVSLKGLLELPVRGKVINLYGPYRNPRYDAINFRSGIDIQADRGEPVRAVAPGTILFADWFKGYGNMVILDHGDNYYTLYAHIEELFKAKGDRVERNEVIATVGDSASLTGPGLYFEVRHHGKPEDPMHWLKQG